jgi:uncharacterized protein YkwD
MKTIFKTATQKQINTILRLHNQYRLHHGVDPLVYDPEISEISQSYADLLAATDTFARSTNTYAGDLFVHIIKTKSVWLDIKTN